MNHEKHENFLYKDESYNILGAAFEVYKEMGSGFLEAVYQECMERELILRQIPFESQKRLQLLYKNQPLATQYVPDLICYGKILIEIKAIKTIKPEHEAQLINYLKSTSIKLGFIVNFGSLGKAEILRKAF